MLIASTSIVLVYMGSNYDGSMTHATYFWVLMKTNMGAFLECGNGSEAGMGGSTLRGWCALGNQEGECIFLYIIQQQERRNLSLDCQSNHYGITPSAIDEGHKSTQTASVFC
jgi:hypothetical protein